MGKVFAMNTIVLLVTRLIAVLAVGVLILVVPMTIPPLVGFATMTLLIMRNILVLVPVVLHKIDPLATGVVLVAMLAPVFCVPRGNA